MLDRLPDNQSLFGYRSISSKKTKLGLNLFCSLQELMAKCQKQILIILKEDLSKISKKNPTMK